MKTELHIPAITKLTLCHKGRDGYLVLSIRDLRAMIRHIKEKCIDAGDTACEAFPLYFCEPKFNAVDGARQVNIKRS